MLIPQLRRLSSVALTTGALVLGSGSQGACVLDPSGIADDDDEDSGDTTESADTAGTTSTSASTSTSTSTTTSSTTGSTGDTTTETTSGAATTETSTTSAEETTAATDTDDSGTTSGTSDSDGSSEDSGFEESGPVGTGIAGLTYAYYRGDWAMLPDFSTLTPEVEREVENFNIYAYEASSGDHFAMVFEGAIRIEQAGMYEFILRSDDGSRLFLGNRRVIDLDGLHDTSEPGIWRRALEPGFVSLRLEYFESTGTESLSLNWVRPGSGGEEPIPDSVLFHFVE